MKMMDNRAQQAGKGEDSSPNMVRRAGGDLGNDPRRIAAQIMIDRTVTMHDQSGYNHAYTPESDRFNRAAERKAMGMGTPNPDGTYSK
jgi:hypothetical protein